VAASTANVKSCPSWLTVSALAVIDVTFPLAIFADSDFGPSPLPAVEIGRTETA
jgi:hypothetical protein